MALAKQPITLFYGDTDQDTGRKSVKLGDLIVAKNCQQVKGGEFSKRDGFTAIGQGYDYQSGPITPDSILSPDGTQVITRDAVTDATYVRGTSNTSNQYQGHATRFVTQVNTRFPALGSGQQESPMAKQSGNYVAWLIDAGHFVIAQVNPDTAAAAFSPTGDWETIIQQTAPISVAAISGNVSLQIKSFAIIDAPVFDAYNLWFCWVDWSNQIFTYSVPHSNLSSGSFHVTFQLVNSGTLYNAFTSVTMGMVDANNLAIAACGVQYDTSAAFVAPGQAGSAATGFRAASGESCGASNYAKSISSHFYLALSGGPASSPVSYLGTQGKAVAACCTIASVAGGFQTSSGTWYYAFVGASNAGDWAIILQSVDAATLEVTTYVDSFPAVAPDEYGRPTDFDATLFARYGWFYNGALAAKETTTGIEIAVTSIPYYVTTNGTFRTWNPDYLATQCFAYTPTLASWSRKWIALGASVAQGWIRLRDYSNTGAHALESGNDYLITQWEDKTALQPSFHVREWDTGAILAQLAYGQAAHIGGTATRDLQVQSYCSDLHQPMVSGVLYTAEGAPLNIYVGLQSANQNACVDIATVQLQIWDQRTNAPPLWQNPVAWQGYSLAPGPIPTICNGFQKVREAGPLVYPSMPEAYITNDVRCFGTFDTAGVYDISMWTKLSGIDVYQRNANGAFFGYRPSDGPMNPTLPMNTMDQFAITDGYPTDGIYTVVNAGSISTQAVIQRSVNANTSELLFGITFHVVGPGGSNIGTYFQETVGVGTIDVTQPLFSPVTSGYVAPTGDTSVAVVYRLTSSDGTIWRSSPYILPNSLVWESMAISRLRVPTLRHLMEGTAAEIEIYIGQVDLQLVTVIVNDSTVDWIDQILAGPTASYPTISAAVTAAGPGELLYTTGGALENAPPPNARAVYIWKDRAFCADGNRIWVSQEFADGIGIQWNDITSIEWGEGTGDILGICHTDWNYLAFFKRDAIAVISGPGPDGMGSGNYSVQTLSTKAGCSNPKSLINGADGCYFQDSQTGRLMLLNASLQVAEAAPGAFDITAGTDPYTVNPITCALHVEQKRQMWFYVGGDASTIIVLDYKHRGESCPAGSVYTWDVSALGAPCGAAIVHNIPTLIFTDGSVAEQTAAQCYDQTVSSVEHAILQSMQTSDINPLGLQRQFNLSRIQFLGEFQDQSTITLTTYPDFSGFGSTSGPVNLTTGPAQFVTRPPNAMRIQSIRFQVDEGVYASIYGRGFKFIGFALEVQDCGKIASLSVGRVI
jgi:hypothetical protein